jgi:NAD(P)-dependent dehydrogenase (short-subunit alcohol dehydrogenase family)
MSARTTRGRLEGKLAIVTGGGGPAIGHGISTVLAAEGAHVVIFEIDMETAELVRKRIEAAGGCVSVLRADVSKAGEVKAAMEEVVHRHKRLDVLVNSAGVGLVRAIAEATEEEFDRLAAIDLRGMWLCCKYAIPQMQKQKGGAIVNIGSVHGGKTIPGFGLYAAIKAGVVGLTRGIAVQYGPDHIRANAICPGMVDGIQTREIVAKLSPDPDAWMNDYVRRHQCIPEFIQPEAVGFLAAFLASDEARSITGAEIPIDAGSWAQLTSRE